MLFAVKARTRLRHRHRRSTSPSSPSRGYGFWPFDGAASRMRGHNLSDVLGARIAWGAALLARRSRPSASPTACAQLDPGALSTRSSAGGGRHRLGIRAAPDEPAPVAAGIMMIVAAIGIVVNGFTAFLFMSGGNGDLNIRGAFLHMVADAAVSARRGARRARDSMDRRGLDRPGAQPRDRGRHRLGHLGPAAQSLHAVAARRAARASPCRRSRRCSRAGCRASPRVHHLHVWAMSTTETALTAHLVMPGGHPGDRFLAEAQRS